MVKVNKDKNSQTIKREEIKESPFVVISDMEKGKHFVSLGEYKITEDCDSKDEAIEKATKISWENIIKIMLIVNEKINNKNK